MFAFGVVLRILSISAILFARAFLYSALIDSNLAAAFANFLSAFALATLFWLPLLAFCLKIAACLIASLSALSNRSLFCKTALGSDCVPELAVFTVLVPTLAELALSVFFFSHHYELFPNEKEVLLAVCSYLHYPQGWFLKVFASWQVYNFSVYLLHCLWPFQELHLQRYL